MKRPKSRWRGGKPTSKVNVPPKRAWPRYCFNLRNSILLLRSGRDRFALVAV
jgi:hypothetical protein